jgi:hypothetical protein
MQYTAGTMTSYQGQPVAELKRRLKESLGSENLLNSSVPIWGTSEELLHGIISDAFSQTVFDDSLTELVVEAWRKLKTIYLDNEVYREAVFRSFELLRTLDEKKQPLPPELVLDHAELSLIIGEAPLKIAESIDHLILKMKFSAGSPTLVRAHLLRARCFREENDPSANERKQRKDDEYRRATSHANRCPRGTNLAVARIFLAQAKSDLINGYTNNSLACIAQAKHNLGRANYDRDGSENERQSFEIELCRAEAAGLASNGSRNRAINSLSSMLGRSNANDLTHNDEYCMMREDLALLHLANGDYRKAGETLIDNLHQAHSEAMQRRAAHMLIIACNAVGTMDPIHTEVRYNVCQLTTEQLSIMRKARDCSVSEGIEEACKEMERVLTAAQTCSERSALFDLCLEGIAWSSFIYFLDPAELRQYLFKIQELADSLSAKDKSFLKTLLDIHVTALMEPPEENISPEWWLTSEEDMLSKADDRLTRLFGDKSFFHGRVALERARMFLVRGQRERASDALLGISRCVELGSYPPDALLQLKMTSLTQAVKDTR